MERRLLRPLPFHLLAWPLLPQHDRAAVIMTHDVKRVFADIDADHGDRCVEFLRHGVLLVLSAPCQLLVLAGPEHGRTIPLADPRIKPSLQWHGLLLRSLDLAEALAQMKLICAVTVTSAGSLLSLLDPAP